MVTPGYSQLTYPLELTMIDGLGQWVARDVDGRGFRDGLTGDTLRYDGARFVSDPDAGAIPPRPDLPPHAGSVQLQIETLHRPSEMLELGASTAAAWRALTGADPLGWGIAEPVSQPWSRRELTSMARSRAPEPTSMIVVDGEPGRLALGTLTVERVSTGVVERLRGAGGVCVDLAEVSAEPPDQLAGIGDGCPAIDTLRAGMRSAAGARGVDERGHGLDGRGCGCACRVVFPVVVADHRPGSGCWNTGDVASSRSRSCAS